MPISVYYFLYLPHAFLAHVLRPNSFHRCSSFTSHCRSFTSLPQKRLRRHAHAFHFPACFQVKLTYFHIHVTFSFRSPPPGPQVVQSNQRHRAVSGININPKVWISVAESASKAILDQHRGWMVGTVGDGRDSRDGFVYVYFRVSFGVLLGFVLEFLLEFLRWDCWEGRDGRGGRDGRDCRDSHAHIKSVSIRFASKCWFWRKDQFSVHSVICIGDAGLSVFESCCENFTDVHRRETSWEKVVVSVWNLPRKLESFRQPRNLGTHHW